MTSALFKQSQGYQQIGEEYPQRNSNFEIENETVAITSSSSSAPATSRFSISRNLAVLIAFILFLVCSIGYVSYSSPAVNDIIVNTSSSGALFDERGRYIMRDYDQLKPMASFLAGLGGLFGIPMWAFYVNRGQGITSFGIQNKDNAIAKFNTADKAYQTTPFTGFRTFVKGKRGSKSFKHMPFFPIESNDPIKGETLPTRNMLIGMNELEIEEVAQDIGLKTNVLYFTIANEDFPGLIRQTTFTNLDTKTSLDIEVLDGLAKLIPSGLNNGALESMGRTMEAWMNVYNVGAESGGPTQPFYHISQGTADVAQVQIIKDGVFVLSFVERAEEFGGVEAASPFIEQAPLLPFIVDPDIVFGTDTTLSNPKGFFKSDLPFGDFLSSPQGTTSRTPCAYAGLKQTLSPKRNVTITSVYGHAEDLETFINKYSPVIRSNGFISKKRRDANSIVDTITSKVSTSTSSALLDSYVKQSFLDNILRGGLPLLLGSNSESPKVYHTFSRIHGDIERDYNFFQIDTSYYSQGPGNFRDVNQNRRLDVFHTPAVGTFNVEMFLSFVQADGYNPLTVATTNFKIKPDAIIQLAASFNVDFREIIALQMMLEKPFRIGQLFKDMKSANIFANCDKTQLINLIADASEQAFAGQFAQNGFWADHWTYTMDLVDGYLTVYPEKEESMLFDITTIPFFMSPAVVKSRVNRYTLVDNNANSPGSSTIRVYNAVSTAGQADYPAERVDAIHEITSDPEYIADVYGAGATWQKSKLTKKTFTVSVFTKLLMLGVLKFSTLDPFGMGVEQEGGKPGWNDAMNGLPGLVGSGLPETYEMLRIIQYLRKMLTQYPSRSIEIPTEFTVFLTSLKSALSSFLESSKSIADEFNYWDLSNIAREAYREATTLYFAGTYDVVSASELLPFLVDAENKVQSGIKAALDTTDLHISPTYFYYETTSYKVVNNHTTPFKVLPTKFKQHKLPLFLEGPTRHLKVIPKENYDEKRRIYNAVKSSAIYDSELQMYALSESLKGLSQEIGRMMAFSPGWLENQSIWLHMSYKFLLELLRGGLYEEFYQDIKTGLVPFMDNKVYGRSPLEASSFIVSSAFPDKKLHGAGFLARLSGSTAEFLSMWALMMAGHSPFVVTSSGELTLQLKPILAGWLFTKDEDTVSFTFLGSCLVTYHNPKHADTWTITPEYAVVTDRQGHQSHDDDAILDAIVASKVRHGAISAIDIYY